ncbi:Stk1 family PASTA domain-containing Ser/Thr kinase [Shimazuella kribbensis]|uniref:Stk1 family PASTA domain-containing Ser/Thr kinase n=1 Tax=Shimazuella kribbensis TaxID=139808 RepID=UPI003CCC3FEC
MQMEGKKLGGRYEIISRIGGGGMAVVYKAKDILLHRNVAIKVLSESLSNDQEFVRRFDREAQAAASLSHPNIVNVYDVGQDGYIHYIVMELVEGPTLKQMILERGTLTTAEAGDIAAQICDGLQHAHDNQIVHRDIKPHNILIGTNGRAKVTDFGIARAASSSTITQTGSVMGSVHYFSPEQARGGQIGSKADIYSLGVVLYEMLTGELPFDGDSAISIALKHLQEPVIDPRELNDKVPESMVNIVMRALEKDPEMRYTSVKAMMQDINYALQFDNRRENRWERPAKTSDIFQTIPISADEETEMHKVFQPRSNNKTNTYQSPIQREEIRSPKRSETNHATQVGQETMAGLERFRNVSNDKDKTVFQRTVIWLDNVQAKLPWWQKLLFSLVTIGIIVFIAIYGFSLVWKLMSGPTNDDNNPGTNTVNMIDLSNYTKEQATNWFQTNSLTVPDIAYKESPDDKEGKVIEQTPNAGEEISSTNKAKITLGLGGADESLKVMDFTGMYQSKLGKYSSGDLGYNIDYSDSRCYNKNTTGQNLSHGQILEQSPKAGEKIEKGGTVYLWIYVPDNGDCKDFPPSLNGSAKNTDNKFFVYDLIGNTRFKEIVTQT